MVDFFLSWFKIFRWIRTLSMGKYRGIKFSLRKFFCIFRMIYNFTTAITRIHFTICKVKSNNSNPHYCCSYFFHLFVSKWSSGLVARALDSQSRSLVFKTTGWLQGWRSFSSFQGYSNEYQELTPRDLMVKGKLSPFSGSVALRQLSLTHKNEPQSF